MKPPRKWIRAEIIIKKKRLSSTYDTVSALHCLLYLIPELMTHTVNEQPDSGTNANLYDTLRYFKIIKGCLTFVHIVITPF